METLLIAPLLLFILLETQQMADYSLKREIWLNVLYVICLGIVAYKVIDVVLEIFFR